MKKFLNLSLIFLVVSCFSFSAKAQSEERNKIMMTINSGGKNITTELSAASFGITRYDTYSTPATDTAAGDTNKTKPAVPERGNYYLSVSAIKVSADLLKVFSKKENRFSGTITITDTYGKNPPREIRFTKASLDSYSDQYTSASYDDAYGYASIVLGCSTLSINGVEME
jgi:hypothetical protein